MSENSAACRRSTSPSSRRSLPPDPVEVAEDAPRLSVADAVASGGMFDVEIVGNVLEIRDGSGLERAVRSAAAWSRTASAGATATWTVRTTTSA